MKLRTLILSAIIAFFSVVIMNNYEVMTGYMLDLFILGQIPTTDIIVPSEIIFLFYALAGIVVVRYWVDFKNGYWSYVYKKVQSAKFSAVKEKSSSVETPAASIATNPQTV